MNAQDRYRLMVRDHLTPAMRERGWRGGSSNYYLPDSTGHIGHLHLYGDYRRSDSGRRTFGVHVGVVSRYLREWFEVLGVEKSKRPRSPLDYDWTTRVATFSISDDDEPSEIAGFVMTIIDAQGIPKVLDSLTDDGLRRAVDSCPVGTGAGGARILLEREAGDVIEAGRRIEKQEASFGPTHEGVVFLKERLAACLEDVGGA